MSKKAHSIRLEERQWRTLELLGKEIGKQTNYPQSGITQMVETAIEKYIALLGKERGAYKKLIERVRANFEDRSRSASKEAVSKGSAVVRIR